MEVLCRLPGKITYQFSARTRRFPATKDCVYEHGAAIVERFENHGRNAQWMYDYNNFIHYVRVTVSTEQTPRWCRWMESVLIKHISQPYSDNPEPVMIVEEKEDEGGWSTNLWWSLQKFEWEPTWEWANEVDSHRQYEDYNDVAGGNRQYEDYNDDVAGGNERSPTPRSGQTSQIVLPEWADEDYYDEEDENDDFDDYDDEEDAETVRAWRGDYDHVDDEVDDEWEGDDGDDSREWVDMDDNEETAWYGEEETLDGDDDHGGYDNDDQMWAGYQAADYIHPPGVEPNFYFPPPDHVIPHNNNNGNTHADGGGPAFHYPAPFRGYDYQAADDGRTTQYPAGGPTFYTPYHS